MKQAQVFLGIDPGFHITGYAIMKKEGGRIFVVDAHYLQMNPKKHLSERVHIFHDFFVEKITQFSVDNIVLETSFLGKNAQTFLKLGYLRGILYLLAAQHNLAIAEFAPREVKQSIAGFGGASKEQVAIALQRYFPPLAKLATNVRSDVTDALAICMCGLWQSQQRALAQR